MKPKQHETHTNKGKINKMKERRSSGGWDGGGQVDGSLKL